MELSSCLLKTYAHKWSVRPASLWREFHQRSVKLNVTYYIMFWTLLHFIRLYSHEINNDGIWFSPFPALIAFWLYMIHLLCCLFTPVAISHQCWGINLTMEQKLLFPFCSTSSPTVPKLWPPLVCQLSALSYGWVLQPIRQSCLDTSGMWRFLYLLYCLSLLQHTHVPRLIPLITSNCTSKSVAVRRWDLPQRNANQASVGMFGFDIINKP